MDQTALTRRLDDLTAALTDIERQRLIDEGMTPERHNYVWHWKERTKYIAIDAGTSGAFLVDKETGELFNIKGYGVPDLNKKKKADIGNILTVDPKVLYTKRYNYLR